MKKIFTTLLLVILSLYVGFSQTVSNIYITQTTGSGQTLIGHYTWDGTNTNLEGTSTYKWYYASDTTTITPTLIDGEISTTYTVQNVVVGKYVSFEVTPIDDSIPSNVGSPTKSIWFGPVVNNAPVASSLSITGNPWVNVSLQANFNYSDNEGDAQGTARYQWLRGLSPSTLTSLSGDTLSSYTVKSGDQGYYLAVNITPIAQTGRTTGATIQYVMPVPVNSYPVATNVVMLDSLWVGQVVRSDYQYSDLDNDGQGVAEYQWLRGSDPGSLSPISTETGSTYTVKSTDQGQYLAVRIKPVATNGSSPGIAIESPAKRVNTVPKVTLSLLPDSVKIGDTLVIHRTYTDLENDPEGGSIRQWYRSLNPGGPFTELIPGGIDTVYIVTLSDKNAYLQFKYTPIARTGANPGIQVITSVVKIENTAPTVYLDPLPATILVGQKLTVTKTYDDLEGDFEGTSILQWYRSRSSSPTSGFDPISGANNPIR